MTLLEAIKKPFLSRAENNKTEYTSEPQKDNVDVELTSLDDIAPTGFFDSDANGAYGSSKKDSTVKKQNELIENYRRISSIPEVDSAIEEVINEAIFTPAEQKHPIVIDFDNDETPLAVQDTVTKEMDIINKMINTEKNLFSLFSSFYVDGQLNVHTAYEKDKEKEGIKKLRILSPINFYFNYTLDRWEYMKEMGQFGTLGTQDTKWYDKEEIIRVDSGIYHNQLILSNVHKAIKPANMLQSLEDMLVPMRFSRSVSRRIFNVDVANLNNKKAEEVMNKTQAKFKYKKFYNVDEGTISKQQHVAALTEDYWFPNRNGSKGTTIDSFDETGNLGEITDLVYMKKKLYTSLKIPSGRVTDEGEGTEFSFDDSSVSREEIKFYAFVSRLRKQFLQLYYDLLTRQIVSKGLMTVDEWEKVKENVIIKFSTENVFFEKMEREKLSEQISQYQDMEDYAGKLFSRRFIFKTVFKMTDDDIKEMSKEIKEEETNPVFSRFYSQDNGEDQW